MSNLLEAVKVGYLYALMSNDDSLRVRSQSALCLMRDAIVAETGQSDQEVQEEFEVKAAQLKREGKGAR